MKKLSMISLLALTLSVPVWAEESSPEAKDYLRIVNFNWSINSAFVTCKIKVENRAKYIPDSRKDITTSLKNYKPTEGNVESQESVGLLAETF